MKQLKFVLTLFLSAVVTLFVATACNTAPSGDGAGSSAQTLTMATSADYPPYEFIRTETGSEEIVGFDVDIANYITERLGYGLKINNIDFNGLIPALQAGRADFVMAGMTPTEERKQNVDFSVIYYEAKNAIVAQQGSNLTTAANLAGKRVGVQLGSIQEEFAKESLQGADVVPLNRINEIIQEIKSRRLDAAIVEDTVATGFIESNPDLEFHTLPNEGESGSAIAFPKGSELVAKFDPILQEMMDSGKMSELITKWFGDQPAS
jgi:polar amino acid transport system substrate-binding protein